MTEPKGDFATVLGPDAHFKGELSFEKGVRLLGQFEGEISSKGEFVVAEGASLKGEVQAGNIQLDGEVEGNLRATGKIQLSASARLKGDLHTNRLEVADGATFVGHCVVGSNGQSNGKNGGVAAPATPIDAAKGKGPNPGQPVGKK